MGIGDEEASSQWAVYGALIHEAHMKWHLTPWWVFWRPKWRRWPGHIECDWEYASDQTRARQALEEACCPPRRIEPTAPEWARPAILR